MTYRRGGDTPSPRHESDKVTGSLCNTVDSVRPSSDRKHAFTDQEGRAWSKRHVTFEETGVQSLAPRGGNPTDEDLMPNEGEEEAGDMPVEAGEAGGAGDMSAEGDGARTEPAEVYRDEDGAVHFDRDDGQGEQREVK